MSDIENNESSVQPNVEIDQVNTQPLPNGKFVTQEELDRLAVANKQRGYEKALKESQSNNSETTSKPAIPDIDNLVDEKFNKKMKEIEEQQRAYELQQMQQRNEEIANKTLAELAPKIQEAKQKHSDFDDVVRESGIGNIPEVFMFANEVPNSGDVIRELAKSPSKLATFKTLTSSGQTQQAALKYIKDLSSSISSNEQAAQNQVPNSPLSSIKSTPVKNDGKLSTTQDWKSYFRGKL